MSEMQYFQTAGHLGRLFDTSILSHALRLKLSGSLVVTSSQPGFNLERGELVTSSMEDEINAYFNCVEAALKAGGVSAGLAKAHKFSCFLRDMWYDTTVMRVWKSRIPDHKPTFVTVCVASLALQDMRVKIAAEAFTDD